MKKMSLIIEIITDEEEWRSMSSLGFSKYEVSSFGRVKTIRTGVIREGLMVEGSLRIGLKSDDKKSKSIFVQVLVATTFLGERPEGYVVCHLDGNVLNNRLDNLKWMSSSENRIRKGLKHEGRHINQLTTDGLFVKRWDKIMDAAKSLGVSHSAISQAISHDGISAGYKWEYCVEEEDSYIDIFIGEEWRPSAYPEYEPFWASSAGRICKPNGTITSGYVGKSGYMVVQIRDNTGRLFQRPVHVFICASFFGRQDNLQVNHKDGDKANNMLNNLEYVTPSQNIIHAIQTGLFRPGVHTRKVHQVDRNGNIIETFDSIIAAHRKTGANASMIVAVCKDQRKTAGGFFWRRAD